MGTEFFWNCTVREQEMIAINRTKEILSSCIDNLLSFDSCAGLEQGQEKWGDPWRYSTFLWRRLLTS